MDLRFRNSRCGCAHCTIARDIDDARAASQVALEGRNMLRETAAQAKAQDEQHNAARKAYEAYRDETFRLMREAKPGEVMYVDGDPRNYVMNHDVAKVYLAPTTLPTDRAARKAIPVATGFVDYFPDAIAAVAAVSKVGGEQHNPGKPLFWDRTKSQDEADTLMRHFLERGTVDTDGCRHSAKVAWRALALLQKEIEADRATNTISVPGTVQDGDTLSGSLNGKARVFTDKPYARAEWDGEAT